MMQVVNSSWRAGCALSCLFKPVFIDEIPFLWQFERGGTFLFIYFVKSYACCRLEVHVMVHGYGYLEDWLS